MYCTQLYCIYKISIQNYILFKILASGVFFKKYYNFANFRLDTLVKYIHKKQVYVYGALRDQNDARLFSKQKALEMKPFALFTIFSSKHKNNPQRSICHVEFSKHAKFYKNSLKNRENIAGTSKMPIFTTKYMLG